MPALRELIVPQHRPRQTLRISLLQGIYTPEDWTRHKDRQIVRIQSNLAWLVSAVNEFDWSLETPGLVHLWSGCRRMWVGPSPTQWTPNAALALAYPEALAQEARRKRALDELILVESADRGAW